MHPAIRNHAWILQLGLVAAVALTAARLVNLTLEVLILPVPSQFPAARGPLPPPQDATPILDVAMLARITGLRVETTPKSDASGGSLRAPLGLRLLGTLRSADPAWSIASLLDLHRQKSWTVMVGDPVGDAWVLEILRDRVIIDRNGRREIIDLAPSEGTLGPAPDRMRDTAAGKSGIRSLDESHYEVPRSELEAPLKHPEQIMNDVHIVPASRDGQPEGFKVFAIRPGTFFARLGLLDGDVVRRINGFEMNTPENVLEAYTRLREANQVEVELERNGSAIRKSYRVR
jgi:general secretion pathway protein C